MNVDCNECGASLSVGDATRFATCVKCKTRLAIKRSENAVYSEKLVDASAKEADAQSVPASTRSSLSGPGGGEALLRIIVGAVLVASDIFWWMTNPSMQSFYVRVVLLGAGAWLVLTGIWRLVKNRGA